MKNVVIFDNRGITFDRFTIVNTKTGDLLAASERPFHPQGFGQTCGNLVDNVMFHKYGAAWRRNSEPKIIKRIQRDEIKAYLTQARANKEWLGIEIDFNKLPEDVQKFINQNFN